MKFVTKLTLAVLVLGGILAATGTALGGTLYTSWYGGRPHAWAEASDSLRGAWDEARQALRLDLAGLVRDLQEIPGEIASDLREIPEEIADNLREIP